MAFMRRPESGGSSGSTAEFADRDQEHRTCPDDATLSGEKQA